MFGSEKGQLVPQLLQSKKNKKKTPKPIYRDLLDTEKSLLLNFQFSDNHDYHEHYSDIRTSKTKQLSFMEKKHLKQTYLQGNFRFLVNPDYEENTTYVDPDKEIKWKVIERVKYTTNNIVHCPICLNEYYDIKFPKITRCGHIFCFSCILKYLSYKKSKCPLCDDLLIEEDLRTVDINYHHSMRPGEKILLKLKKRRKSENTVYNTDNLTEEDFIRIKRITWEEILKLREEEVKSLGEFLTALEIEGEKDLKPQIEHGLNSMSAGMEKVHKVIVQARQKKKIKEEEEIKAEDIPNEEEFLYFYQDINGLNIFLHPINNKYIKTQYNNNEELPPIIETHLIENKGFQQSELSQRRYKFLNHIPLNSNISFAEIDMKNLISKENYEALEEEMKNYKENNTNKKEGYGRPLSNHHLNQFPSKKITVPSEGKYKIEFPVAPSELKLSDSQDYPALPAAHVEVSSAAKNVWQQIIPSKKKSQASKKNNPQNATSTIATKSTLPSIEEKIEEKEDVIMKKDGNDENVDNS